MTTLRESAPSLRHWVQEPLHWYDRDRRKWLQAVDSARTSTFRRFQRAGLSGTATETGSAVDELIGLMLMRRFVYQKSRRAIKGFRRFDTADRETVRSVCNRLCDALSSPLLRAAFDSLSVCDKVEFPAEAIPSPDDELCRLGDLPFPVTAFGDFHQLCLARPLSRHSDVDIIDERRSRGVHFTPSPLVDYLIDSTLSRLLIREDNSDLHILDPSCGSGIFLIATMRFLAESNRAISQNAAQNMLDAAASHVFGIDINSTAIEWARRSLLLAVWETAQDINHSSLCVPDLRRNLVAADFLAQDSPPGFPVEFDAIIGGPPFVRFRQMKSNYPIQVKDWRKRFVTARRGQFDLYMPFFEQSIGRLKTGGQLGWSVSSTFLRAKFGAPLREFIGSCCTVNELIEFESAKIYADAVTQIVLIQLRKESGNGCCRHARVRGKPELRSALEAIYAEPAMVPADSEIWQLSKGACRGRNWRLTSAESAPSVRKGNKSWTLKALGVQTMQGIVTGADAVFRLRVIDEAQQGRSWVEDRQGRRHCVESSLLKPAIRSREIRGYSQLRPRSHLLVPHDAHGKLLAERDLKMDFPAAYSYLSMRRHDIPRTRNRSRPFYAFRQDAVLRLAPGPRIVIGMVTSGADATLDLFGGACAHAGVLVLSQFPGDVDPFYLLGVINSPVFWSFVQATMPTMGNGRHSLRRGSLARFPVVLTSDSTQTEIAGRVRQLIESTNDDLRTSLKRGIDNELTKVYRVDIAADKCHFP